MAYSFSVAVFLRIGHFPFHFSGIFVDSCDYIALLFQFPVGGHNCGNVEMCTSGWFDLGSVKKKEEEEEAKTRREKEEEEEECRQMILTPGQP